eukprot:TRINITY_DN7294_c0_g1_i2.p1 TRINITY_DN7294_c0_g1~~TRINITY_DN7294_c0_g1_i2.p1  ORF type:complete len:163 (+),score=11.30 TRINITY_DN7294_c0_g1_i2:89-577(+)
MGKYFRKREEFGEIAVMEISQVGVRTRAKTLALAAKNRRRKPVSPANSIRFPADRCRISERSPAARCDSSGSSEIENQRFRTLDLEGEGLETVICLDYCRERRETTPSSDLCSESDNLDSTARQPEMGSGRKSTAEKMPLDAEIEEFFAAAEGKEKKRFAER